MTNGIPAPQPPKVAHGIFVGSIDQTAVQRLSNAMSAAVNNGIEEVHLLFQSSGGIVGDGVCLFNLFRSLPISVTLYNAGSVASIAVIAYLGAKNRITSANATFMIHKTYFSPIGATSERLQAAANAAVLDDKRIESVLASLELPKENWELHKFADLWLSADEALASGLSTAKGDFSPVKGEQLFYVGAV